MLKRRRKTESKRDGPMDLKWWGKTGRLRGEEVSSVRTGGNDEQANSLPVRIRRWKEARQ